MPATCRPGPGSPATTEAGLVVTVPIFVEEGDIRVDTRTGEYQTGVRRAMSDRRGIEALLYLLDEAFRGVGIEESNESQALLPNLRSVPDAAWHALPEGLSRSIESIAIHVGACKVMYDDYAFGDGTLRFATPEVEPWRDGESEMADVIPWLEAAQQRLVDHLAALAGDEALDLPRLTNWGELLPTRWIIATMITHDAYHAGEINHLRSLLGPDDRWRFKQLGFG